MLRTAVTLAMVACGAVLVAGALIAWDEKDCQDYYEEHGTNHPDCEETTTTETTPTETETTPTETETTPTETETTPTETTPTETTPTETTPTETTPTATETTPTTTETTPSTETTPTTETETTPEETSAGGNRSEGEVRGEEKTETRETEQGGGSPSETVNAGSGTLPYTGVSAFSIFALGIGSLLLGCASYRAAVSRD